MTNPHDELVAYVHDPDATIFTLAEIALFHEEHVDDVTARYRAQLAETNRPHLPDVRHRIRVFQQHFGIPDVCEVADLLRENRHDEYGRYRHA